MDRLLATVLLEQPPGAEQPFDTGLLWLARQGRKSLVVRALQAWRDDAGCQERLATLLFFLRSLKPEACGALRSVLAEIAGQLVEGGEAALQQEPALTLHLARFGFLGERGGSGGWGSGEMIFMHRWGWGWGCRWVGGWGWLGQALLAEGARGVELVPTPPTLADLPACRRWLCVELKQDSSRWYWNAPVTAAEVPALPWFLAVTKPSGLTEKEGELWDLRAPLKLE